MRGYFYGWYLKCQSDTQTLAVIPAVHQVGGKRTCSIQIITNDGTWTVEGPGKLFRCKGKQIRIGKNRFEEYGIRLAVKTSKLSVKGALHFGRVSSLNSDIMGPFAWVPFMECRHSVYSMQHLVSGSVCINGQIYSFQNALGYWEGDRGWSFPKEYAWTQCFFEEGSIMLSVADIPIAGIHFTGIIGVVFWKGKEYRLATYLGARVICVENRVLRIVQGSLELEAVLLEEYGQALKAPTQGNMVRIIRESAECKAAYRLRKKGQTILDFETNRASFEYEYIS